MGDSADRSPLNDLATDGFYAQTWTFGEHTGTHMDAPGHFTAGGRLVPQLRPEEFFAPIVVIDIAARAASDPDTVVTPDDLRAYERRYGRIPGGAAVLMNSGWDVRAADPAAFKNADAAGGFHFPGFSGDAVSWLLARRDARIIGVDTLVLDPGNSADFIVHVTWLGADRFGLEGLANLGSSRPPGRGWWSASCRSRRDREDPAGSSRATAESNGPNRPFSRVSSPTCVVGLRDIMSPVDRRLPRRGTAARRASPGRVGGPRDWRLQLQWRHRRHRGPLHARRRQT